MKRYLTALILCTLSLSSQLAHADLIDDAIGNIQQAISDAYRPGDSRPMTRIAITTAAMMMDATRAAVSKAAIASGSTTIGSVSWTIAADSLTIASASWIRIVGSWKTIAVGWTTTTDPAPIALLPLLVPGSGLIQHDLHTVIARLKPRRQRVVHHPGIKLVADMGENDPRAAHDQVDGPHRI